MKKYEIRIESCATDDNQDYLNRICGNEGWQLVAVVPRADRYPNSVGCECFHYFQREIIKEETVNG